MAARSSRRRDSDPVLFHQLADGRDDKLGFVQVRPVAALSSDDHSSVG